MLSAYKEVQNNYYFIQSSKNILNNFGNIKLGFNVDDINKENNKNNISNLFNQKRDLTPLSFLSAKNQEKKEEYNPLKPSIVEIKVSVDEDEEDTDIHFEMLAKEREARGIFVEKVRDHELDMKLVDVECGFEGK